MNKLDQMLNPAAEATLHPLVRFWKERIQSGDKIQVEVHRSEAAVGIARTDLVVRRWEKGTEQEPKQFEWDDDLNASLIRLGVRASDLQNEGVRFSLGLRAALRKVERRYGDGYLNSVLVELIDESDLSQTHEIADVRKHVYAPPPLHGRSYTDCRELIANEIGGRAVELRDDLKYEQEEVKTVMEKALAMYLDERFSVSNRRRFGLL